MRIVFIGAVEFSFAALKHLVSMRAEIVGVCTVKQSKFNADHVDLANFCGANRIPSFYIEDINSEETLAWIKEASPDIIFCFGWSKLIKENLLMLAPLGVIGYHPAALPANRGRHPITWALVLGLKKTASTFFFMNAGTDSGDILSQEEILIEDNDNARTLYDKLTCTGLNQITKFLPRIINGSFQRIKQDDRLANSWRKRGDQDGKIDWRMSAESIYNLVRGLSSPYVGAHFLFDGREVKVWQTSIIYSAPENAEPGKVISHVDGILVVKCGADAIALLAIDPVIKINVGRYLL